MYAVIKTGGKQERVEEGQTLAVELLGAADGEEVTFDPVLVVDGETVLSRRNELAASKVSARVVGDDQGSEGTGFHVQAEDPGPPPLGSPPALHDYRDHRHQPG